MHPTSRPVPSSKERTKRIVHETSTTCNHRRRHPHGLSVNPVAAVGWRTVHAAPVPCQRRRRSAVQPCVVAGSCQIGKQYANYN